MRFRVPFPFSGPAFKIDLVDRSQISNTSSVCTASVPATMKMKTLLLLLSALCLAKPAFAQESAFTYQGRLNNAGSPANGLYDLTFTIYDLAMNASKLIAGPITNSATLVSNGLFTTILNFGTNTLNRNAAWMEIGVRTNGNAAFASLSPRQQLTPTPYALFANTASNVVGIINATTLNGQSSSAFAGSSGSANYLQNQNNSAQAANSWISGTAQAGNFIGDGSGLTHVPPSASSAPASPSAGQLYFDTTLNSLRLYDGTAWGTIALAGNPGLRQQLQSASVLNGNSLILSGFTTFPIVTIWVLVSGTAYINVTGNASYPVAYDSGSKWLSVTNNSGSTKSMVITAVGQ